MGGYAAPALSSPFIVRQILTRIVLPTGEVGEAVVLKPGTDLLHTDTPQLITGAGFHLRTPALTGPQAKGFLSPSSACPICFTWASGALQWTSSFPRCFLSHKRPE